MILDTGNNRVRILTSDGCLMRTVVGEPLGYQSTVGLACSPCGQTFVTLNWRSKCVTEWTMDGREVKTFTFSEFVEPLDVAVDGKGRILVADNGAKKIFVFDRNARPQFSFPVKTSALSASGGKMRSSLPTTPQVTCVAVGVNNDIVVGGSDVQLYDHSGRFVSVVMASSSTNQINSNNSNNSSNIINTSKNSSNNNNVGGVNVGNISVGGLAVDEDGYVLVTVNDKKSSYINVCHYKGQILYSIDSHAAKLKRPSGICIAADDHCIVADLGNNCIKKYRYK